MNSRRTHKKNLIVSYKNLSEELIALFQERYPEGYKDYLQRFDKPNGDTIFVVPLETDDAVYMIKFDVKIDTAFDDDDSEKDYFDEEVEKADEEFAPLQEAIDKEDEDGNSRRTVREVRHGDYEAESDKSKKRPKPSSSLSALGDELREAFADDIDDAENDEYDDELDEDAEGRDDEYDEDEPTDEELMDIESEVYANAEIPPEELAALVAAEAPAPQKSKRGRKKKVVAEPAPVPAAPKKKGRPRKIKTE